MENLDRTKLNKPEGVDFKFTLTEKERQDLMQELKEIKKRLRLILAGRKSKGDPAPANPEILDVEVDQLNQKELCLFRLYRALRDSQGASVDDWQKVLLAITDYREQIRVNQQPCAEPETFCDSREMTMQDEFLAWLYNLALSEYGKVRGEELADQRRAA